MIHLTPFLWGALIGPLIWIVAAYALHRFILLTRWCVRVVKGGPIVLWPVLLAASWALPKLTYEYCLFRTIDGRVWFSPRLEKFRVLPRPKQED